MQMWPFSEMSLSTATLVGTAANWILLACLLGGVLSTFVIVKATDVKEEHWDNARRQSQERIAELTKETTRLSTEGDEARAAIAGANARALEAQVALEKFKAPRVLSAEQQAKIGEKLASFAGMTYDVGIVPKGDLEPLYLSRTIHAALTLAGWKQIAWTESGDVYSEAGIPAIGLTTVSNVIVDVHPDRWAKFGEAATALANSLAAEGIDAIADSQPASINTDAIHIRIGRKL
jgi:hypothetical protein